MHHQNEEEAQIWHCWSVLQVVEHVLEQFDWRMRSLRLLEFTYLNHRGWELFPDQSRPLEEFATQSHLDFLIQTVTAMYKRRTLVDWDLALESPEIGNSIYVKLSRSEATLLGLYQSPCLRL